MALTGILMEDKYPLPDGMRTKKDIQIGGSANLDMSNSTGSIKVPTGGFTAGASGNVDFSASSGTFKTTTGAVTLGPGAITASGSVTVATGKTLAVTDSAALTIGGVIVANYEYVTSPTFAAATFANGSAYPLYTFPNDGTTWKLVFASLRFTTAASGAATAQVFLDPSGTAPGAGTAQFAAMALNGANNTVVNATTPVGTTTAAGGCISLAAAGAATTALVGMVCSIAMQRLS